jgi:predicted Ser/Thr protein kinase
LTRRRPAAHPARGAADRAGRRTLDLDRFLVATAGAVKDEFSRRNAVMSFPRYLQALASRPASLTRGAARYMVDAVESAGEYEVPGIGAPRRRRRAFDDPGGSESTAEVFGQEEVQDRFLDVLSEFARRGRSDRFILLHGPNGAAKSSLIEALVRALERYSRTPAGALYRTAWIFCESQDRERLGFGRSREPEEAESLADVDERLITSRLPCELKDPPFFLIPKAARRAFFEEALATASPEERAAFRFDERILEGEPGPKSRVVYETLLKSYDGDWRRVMRHVRVERYDISRRFRSGAVLIEPQGTIDAQSRLLAHASTAGLPPVLSHETIVEASGDLIDANGGLVEFSDFFKRPIEASKYLLTTAERGVLNLPGFTAHLNLVLCGTTDEKYLAAFKRDPSFPSFKGRFELVRCPYLLEYKKEAQIYARHLAQVRGARHVAPHTAVAIALWAVLTRLRRPDPGRYPPAVQAAIRRLTPVQKARLYDRGELPRDLGDEEQKLLRAEIVNLRSEFDDCEEEFEGYVDAAYEGRDGASPREIMSMLSEIAVETARPCISPVDLFESLPRLIRDRSLYRFLRLERDGQYRDPQGFVEAVRKEYVRHLARELQQASELVAEGEYGRLFLEYFRHVKAFDVKEKVQNPATGKAEPPDERLMAEVESRLDLKEPVERFRRDLMTRIAAFRIDHPTKPLVYEELFEGVFGALRRKVFEEQKSRLVRLAEDALAAKAGVSDGAAPERRDAARGLLDRLVKAFGYCDACSGEMLSYFLRYRDEIAEL